MQLADVPGIGLGVYQTWRELAATSGSGMGPAPISWGEIAAWQSATGIRLTGWELETLREMDVAALTTGQSAGKP